MPQDHTEPGNRDECPATSSIRCPPCILHYVVVGALLGFTGGDRSEHQGPTLDVIVNGLGGAQDVLEVIGVIGVNGQDFLLGALVQDELQSPSARLSRISCYPRELVVAELAHVDGIIGDGLLGCG